VKFGTELAEIGITDRLTVERAFKAKADVLGFDPERAVNYRNRGQLIDGTERVKADEIYVASVTHEQKG
jgi:hypothetical protein